MKNSSSNLNEYDLISDVIQHYIDGAKSGRSDDMKAAFHEDATIFGYVQAGLFAGPIQQFFDWHDENGRATGLKSRIVSIDLVETVATVRIALGDWRGARFTDLFTLLKVDGDWKIMNKVFHLHA